jgi:hypothetical protein
MHPDAESETRSPWYEAFAQQAHTHVVGIDWIAAAMDDGAEGAAQPETAEPECSTEALFDCYNG